VAAHAIWTWRVSANAADAVDEAVTRLVDHVNEDHPLIASVRLYSSTDADGSRTYLWHEEYSDAEAMARDHYTEECQALWKPVREAAMPGTFKGGPWETGPMLVRDEA
jgi:quinol monooxygenase YgiN